ncbi:hypothetical protein Lqui_2515 [Legionella quinlivanii]|uniref:Uncharacterized protein n=2 Tax=Legionella quinlivanii TaxID=45073 RepID=A0A0W0XPS7_9GAMM|nr:hypothetical protein Lqui_2515 [Legionella quinlivanii]SEG08551.1 hypothetical protein SAMN02746093_01813 [Legionella quinlivanii DSM 21216]STY10279.1 Uncharacterised protein [Legionella quinlivanii]
MLNNFSENGNPKILVKSLFSLTSNIAGTFSNYKTSTEFNKLQSIMKEIESLTRKAARVLAENPKLFNENLLSETAILQVKDEIERLECLKKLCKLQDEQIVELLLEQHLRNVPIGNPYPPHLSLQNALKCPKKLSEVLKWQTQFLWANHKKTARREDDRHPENFSLKGGLDSDMLTYSPSFFSNRITFLPASLRENREQSGTLNLGCG